jgi:hypothetical protein
MGKTRRCLTVHAIATPARLGVRGYLSAAAGLLFRRIVAHDGFPSGVGPPQGEKVSVQGDRSRALSFRAAQDCENATGPTCKCRCNGAFHGKGRVVDTRTLPLDDPHSPSTECRKCDGTGKLLGWDFAANIEAEIACWKCKGAGRVLARAVQKAAIPGERP